MCTAMDPKPVYHLLAGDAAHHISQLRYEDPAEIGIFPSKLNDLSPFKDKEPEKLQCFDDDIGMPARFRGTWRC